MADQTGIEWTDATWNPVVGCSLVSPGCTNCYAMGQAARIVRCSEGLGRASTYDGTVETVKGKPVWTGKVALASQATLTQPLRWQKPRRIFVNSMGDLFHEDVPDEWIDRVFAVMALAPQHSFQILTKRSARMRAYLSMARAHPVGMEAMEITLNSLVADPKSKIGAGCILQGDIAHLKVWPLPNVWLGVSAEDQRRADERIPDLLATPAAIRFVSAEPLLGAIDFTTLPPAIDRPLLRLDGLTGKHHCGSAVFGDDDMPRLDWIIVGGESGPNARPMHPDWARSIRDQCAAAGTAFFFKQNGEWAPPDAFGATQWGPATDDRGNIRKQSRYYVETEMRADRLDAHSFDGHWTRPVFRVGKARAGRLLDGVTHDAMPEGRA